MRASETLLFNFVFVILPLAAEIGIICAILLGRYDAVFTAIIVVTLAFYCAALVVGSEKLRKHQRRAVATGAEAMGKAVDAMLNYETVKYFGNEGHVARRYDTSLREVERLQIKAYAFRSLTGVLQMTIMGVGMTLLVVLAALKVEDKSMTVGDFVLVNTYLLQLIRPIERLGQLYRGIKQALTELELMLGLLDEMPEVKDAPDARAAARRPRADPVRERVLRLRPAPSGARRRVVHRAARHHHRHRRPLRRRQVDHRAALVPLLRSDARRRSHRRRRLARGDAEVAPRRHRGRAAGRRAVQRVASATTSSSASRARPKRRSRMPRASPRSTISSPRCRMATTPWSASAG